MPQTVLNHLALLPAGEVRAGTWDLGVSQDLNQVLT